MLKSAHYAAIHLLFKNGHSKRAIAHLTNHDRKTVDKVLRTEAPVPVQRRIRKHKLDAFRKPLEQQLKAGSVTCDQLLSFSRSLGFDGSKRMLQRFVREFRERHTAGVPCGSSLLTASHHWMLRLMQGGISTKDLQADVGGILSIKDSDLIVETMRTGHSLAESAGCKFDAVLRKINRHGNHR